MHPLVLNEYRDILDLLKQTRVLECKPLSSPMDSKPNLMDSTSPFSCR